MRTKFLNYLPYYKYSVRCSSLWSEAALVLSQNLFGVPFQPFQYDT